MIEVIPATFVPFGVVRFPIAPSTLRMDLTHVSCWGTESEVGDEQVFKIKTGQLLRKFDSAHSQGITSLGFSRDGTHILSASYDGLARVHGLKSGKLLKEFRGHTSYVNHATYSPDGTQVTIRSATEF